MGDKIEPTVVSHDNSYEITRFNAVRHGVLSRYTVLPWEDRKEYQTLLEALLAEHKPVGPTEEHLVEELAGAMWRKGRLRLGERAVHMRALQRTTNPDQFPTTSKAALVHVTANFGGKVKAEAVSATEEQSATAVKNLEEDEVRVREALKVIETKSKDSYSQALSTLSKEEQAIWQKQLMSDVFHVDLEELQFFAEAQSLKRFLEMQTLPRYQDRRYELEHRPLIREQSFGEAVDTQALEGLARYEIHLDRKLERTLAMLLKLQSLRRDVATD